MAALGNTVPAQRLISCFGANGRWVVIRESSIRENNGICDELVVFLLSSVDRVKDESSDHEKDGNDHESSREDCRRRVHYFAGGHEVGDRNGSQTNAEK